ncbi:hypothetical protein Asp14428_35150 [Actinoplanes sp. NBRC 14428]|nr:hypothetical protein Asp14428_35150 [Actinoplanes sp. NBRC 14428]
MVIIVALLCAAWVVQARHRMSEAEKDLAAADAQIVDLQRAQRQYTSVVQLQRETDTLKSQLKTAMADDLDWAAMLSMLRSTGEPMKVEIEGINGTLNTAGSGKSAAESTLPSTSDSANVGAAIVNGTAPDKEAVAAYVDALGKKAAIANPYVTNVASDAKSDKDDKDVVTFSLSVSITRDALCGRFGESCKTTGGK